MATEWGKLKVTELKAELKRRALPQAGVKADLVARLTEDDNKEAEEERLEQQDDTEASQEVVTEEVTEEASEEVATNDIAGADDARQAEIAQETVSEPVTKRAAEADDAANEPPTANQQTPVTDKPALAESPVVENGSARPRDTQDENGAPVLKTQVDETAAATPAPKEGVSPTLPTATSSEVQQDFQKRKRRSNSPPPSGESLNKRTKQDDSTDEDIKVAATTANPHAVAQSNGAMQERAKAESASEITDTKMHEQEKIAEAPKPLAVKATKPLVAISDAMDEGKPGVPQAEPDLIHAEEERDVPPSVHPASTALYIKNFMRPLREVVVEDHLAGLATPPGQAVDPGVIVSFYLDPIRTHAFVEFTSRAAASRVRTALHDQVWPDERNRKALWVDFIPPEEIAGWVDKERAGGGGRSASSRWEVYYDREGDHVIATLQQEASPDSRATRAPAPAPAAAAAAAPAGAAASQYPGIDAAPAGPRAQRGERVSAPRATAMGLTTRSNPPLSVQPVPEELARRRLDNIQGLVSRDPTRRLGREINRYSFENGDRFVDRGPEIFEGIRPPHREREQRRRGPRGGRRGGPPFRPGSDRYVGSGDRRRDDGSPPRTRFDDDRWSRDENRLSYDDYRDRRY